MSNKQKKPKAGIFLLILIGLVAIVLIYVYGPSMMGKSAGNEAAIGRSGPIIVQPHCNPSTYQGVTVSFISGVATKTTVAGANNDRAVFRLRYSIRTGGCPLFIPIRPVATFQWWSGSGSSIASGGIFGYPDNPILQQNIYPNNYYRIAPNTQENFTSTFNIDLAAANSHNHGAGYYRLYLSEVKWDLTNAPTPSQTFLTGFTPASTSTVFTTNWVNLN